ncbi:hypothetical protein XFF6991_480098 [Xanthomonas phaseoli pv. phaseoli]|uniref:Uncharacterized protein n=1 Tax=Xanthomonas campestris pv. phaseoli TaxID=317013 RepID=A0A7Z7NID3_XANCH|nr:hypothetical protein XFF6991_480098 [Xanthomonas phaseoli pv. phaseoli]
MAVYSPSIDCGTYSKHGYRMSTTEWQER